jgi:heme-degrading monooxygenase HmoA
MQRNGGTGHVYRVDRFVVPSSARDEFLSRVKATHDALREQSGFVRDTLLEQFSGPGEFTFVTIAEWESESHIDEARSVVVAMHKQSNFNVLEVFQRLGIKADIANYREVHA